MKKLESSSGARQQVAEAAVSACLMGRSAPDCDPLFVIIMYLNQISF